MRKKQKNQQIHPKIIKMTPKNGYFSIKYFFQKCLKMREEVENHPKNHEIHLKVVKIRYFQHIQNLNMPNIRNFYIRYIRIFKI